MPPPHPASWTTSEWCPWGSIAHGLGSPQGRANAPESAFLSSLRLRRARLEELSNFRHSEFVALEDARGVRAPRWAGKKTVNRLCPKLCPVAVWMR
jgi:hypothetical protein